MRAPGDSDRRDPPPSASLRSWKRARGCAARNAIFKGSDPEGATRRGLPPSEGVWGFLRFTATTLRCLLFGPLARLDRVDPDSKAGVRKRSTSSGSNWVHAALGNCVYALLKTLAAVSSLMRDGIEAVRDRYHAGRQRNPFTFSRADILSRPSAHGVAATPFPSQDRIRPALSTCARGAGGSLPRVVFRAELADIVKEVGQRFVQLPSRSRRATRSMLRSVLSSSSAASARMSE